MTKNPLFWTAAVCLALLTWRAWLLIDGVRSAAWGVASVPREISDLQRTVSGLPDRILPPVLAVVDSQATALRKDAAAEIDKGLGRVDAALDLVDDRSLQAMKMAGVSLASMLATVDGLHQDLHPILANVASVTAQVDDGLPLFLDCEFNPDCAFNRWQGATKAFEKAAINVGEMSQAARAALPQILQTAQANNSNVAGITSDFHHMTTEIDRKFFGKQTLRQTIWGGIKFGLTGAGTAARAGLL
jgi:hypothetical protein